MMDTDAGNVSQRRKSSVCNVTKYSTIRGVFCIVSKGLRPRPPFWISRRPGNEVAAQTQPTPEASPQEKSFEYKAGAFFPEFYGTLSICFAVFVFFLSEAKHRRGEIHAL